MHSVRTVASPTTPAAAALPHSAKLAIVLSHPIQYYSPWFCHLVHAGWNLRVFYLWDFGVRPRHDPGFGRSVQWDIDLLSGYPHEFVPNWARKPGTDHFTGMVNPMLGSRLARWKPDVVLLFGYKYVTHLSLILRSRWPLVFRGDSHLIDHPPVRRIKSWLLSHVYRRFAAITYVGEANRDYFRAFGVPDARLHFAPHAIDTGRFQATPAARAAADELRRQLNLEHRTVVLYAGKLVPAKQPRELLDAFLELAPRDAALVFVGDGSEKAALQTAASHRSDIPVHILPFANQSEMPSRYLLADIFALPSGGLAETWGLAVQEAMHLGVPCIVSNRVGCQRDLVTDGETGWVFRADSPAELRQTLGRALADSRDKRAQFSVAARKRAAAYSYDAATTGLRAAVAAALSTRQS